MIFHVTGHIVRKRWDNNQSSMVDSTETIGGTLCYIKAESETDARDQVVKKFPDFKIESVELLTEDQITLMLTKQNTQYHIHQ